MPNIIINSSNKSTTPLLETCILDQGMGKPSVETLDHSGTYVGEVMNPNDHLQREGMNWMRQMMISSLGVNPSSITTMTPRTTSSLASTTPTSPGGIINKRAGMPSSKAYSMSLGSLHSPKASRKRLFEAALAPQMGPFEVLVCMTHPGDSQFNPQWL